MTTTWGGTSIPDPTNITMSEDYVGAQFLTADGALNTDTIDTELRISLTWELITYAEFGTIYSKILTNVSATLVLPVYGTFTVIPVRGQTQTGAVGGKSTLVNASCVVRTVS